MAQKVNSQPATWETQIGSLGQEAPLEKEMATRSSILAWRIPWTKEPGGLQSTGVTQSWTGLNDRAHMHILCDLGRWESGRMQLRTELCQG